MENLAPPYLFVLHLIQDIENGLTPRTSVKKFVSHRAGDFIDQLRDWLACRENGVVSHQIHKSVGLTAARRAIFDLLELSQRGVSVLEPLRSLEEELKFNLEQDMEAHLGRLPYLLMIPLLLLQFPALLLLVLGPVLAELLREVGG